MLADLLQPIGEVLFEIAFYFFGRLLVWLISLGRWRCEPLLSDVPKHRTRWGGLFHYRNGRIYFTSEGTAAIGVVFCLALVAAGVVVWYLRQR